MGRVQRRRNKGSSCLDHTCFCVFIHSPIHSLFRLFSHSFNHSLSHSLIHSYTHSFSHHSFIHSFVHSLVHLFNHSANILQSLLCAKHCDFTREHNLMWSLLTWSSRPLCDIKEGSPWGYQG